MKKIELTRNQFALVDDEDYEYLNQWKWHAMPGRNKYYAQRVEYVYLNGKRSKILHTMHSSIMKLTTKEFVIDHIDGDGLNNQKINLRKCTRLQNSFNRIKQNRKATSNFKGVYWYKSRNCWRAQIMFNRKTIPLGYFNIEESAAIAYNDAAIKYFGEFAKLNSMYHVMA